MKKKISKFILSALPRLYNEDGEIVSNRSIANKIYDSIPNPEKLDIEPFETWIPIVCSTCHFNGGHRLGCTFEFFGEELKRANPIPENCPKGFRN